MLMIERRTKKFSLCDGILIFDFDIEFLRLRLYSFYFFLLIDKIIRQILKVD